MESPWNTLEAAVREANELDFAVGRQADTLAKLLLRRLRHVNPHYLKDLKRELQTFDAGKRKWK